MIKSFIVLTLGLFVSSLHSFNFANCFPENSLSFPVDAKNATGLNEAEFNLVLDEFEAIMATEVDEVDSAELEILRLWDDDQVNAYAYQQGNLRYLGMFGGLARHPEATSDVFRLVACHELGHHLGGAPKKSGGGIWGGGNKWASNEGQSDYYASSKCFRRLVIEGRKQNLAIASPDLSAYSTEEREYAKSKCKSSFNDDLDSEICIRASLAAYSVGRLFESFRSSPRDTSLKTPDPKQVSSIDDRHPDSQCRTDTYFQGALCEVSYRDRVDNDDANFNTCNRKDNYKVGIRPLCWYKPSRSMASNNNDTGWGWF